jgi:hypothetical protein
MDDVPGTRNLDQMLIARHRHLKRVPRHYVGHYNEQRLHRCIEVEVPAGLAEASFTSFEVQCHDLLGGLIHEYRPAPA